MNNKGENGMEKNLNAIVKKTANRYGLSYDENRKEHMVQDKDGNITPLRQEDIKHIFGISSPK